jgi:predicted RecB family nuclease
MIAGPSLIPARRRTRRNAILVYRLTKSTFVSGWQCPNRLWWEVHEPDAPELRPTAGDRYRMEQGKHVDRLARDYVPGGVLIAGGGPSPEDRIDETRRALDAGAPAIYNACFAADGVFVAVDILERNGRGGHNLVEVKATTALKDEHIPDAAIQVHVLRRSGVNVARAEVMHLNGECRYPDLSNLFVREDVSRLTAALEPEIDELIPRLVAWIDGANPDVPIGEQCFGRNGCAFRERCWPKKERDHVLTLAGVGLRGAYELMQRGIHSIHDLPPGERLPKAAQRQVRAVRQGTRIIGRGLRDALAPFSGPLAHLDFETVSRAIPVWDGCRPWEQVPVQFSCHVQTVPGGLVHHAWLAEGPDDPREPLARALIDACRGASAVVAYYASFERSCIERLAAALPHLAPALDDINDRLVDLHPVVKDYVYDPGFEGSFSLKSVIPALLPAMSYDDLAIAEGETASAELARLLFEPMAAEQRATLRTRLLAYCERDTAVMVALLAALRELAEIADR